MERTPECQSLGGKGKNKGEKEGNVGEEVKNETKEKERKQVRIHDKTSRVLLGRGGNAQKLLKAQEKLKKVNGGRTDGPTDRPTDRVTYRVACTRIKTHMRFFLGI